MRQDPDHPLLSVEQAGGAMGVSRSTVWRLIRRGSIRSIKKGGRRLIPRQALLNRGTQHVKREIPPLTREHSIFQFVGAGRSGGRAPGARDKHAILDQ